MKKNNIIITYNEYIKENLISRSENFKKWFSGSKITDNNNEPMVCYHGTSVPDITVFDMSKIGEGTGNYGHYGYGIYFSVYKNEAKIYGANIYKCYIRILNPFIGNDEQILQLKENGVGNIDELSDMSIDFKSFKDCFKNDKLVYTFLSNYEDKGLEYAWKEFFDRDDINDSDSEKLNGISDLVDYTTLNNEVDGLRYYVLDDLKKLNINPKINRGFELSQRLHWITDLGNRSEEVTNVIKKLGYDGIFYGSEIVVFYPNQIKSADNNDGSWDINNIDINS